ncbi:MAG TPA: SDR family oxidoreductase [Polyangia bacterium]|jgi:NAD(P)-dependent dehydrogenase (short-subunit alcohol dehydrogenase family)
MSLAAALKGDGPSGFGYGTTAMEVTEGLALDGRTILVTGCASGLGLETIRALAARGARVIATARTVEKAREAHGGMTGDFLPLACDLVEPASVRACIASVKNVAPLDAIICNAGIMAPPRLRQAHGYELQFFTNHIGHFILVTGLLERLSPDGRVVVVASNAHRRATRGLELDNLSGERDYAPMRTYGRSKLANVLFTRELARRLGGGGPTANCLHPGVIATNLMRSVPVLGRIALRIATPLVLKSPPQGAATQCYLATHPSVAGATGGYYRDCNLAAASAAGRDDDAAAQLWETSEAIVAKFAT